MPVLTARNLSKAYGPQTILDDVTLTIRTGERVGLVGLNGSGKTTLTRILAGVEQADFGELMRRRGAEIAYLAQEPVFDADLTAREVVSSGLRAWSEAKARHDAIGAALAKGHGDLTSLLEEQEVAALDVERLGGWGAMHQVSAFLNYLGVERPDDPVANMSGGERRRVALARILVSRPALAILDEPTNHLDVETIEWLERYLLEEHKGALLLITHDRYVLDRVVERTLELDKGKVYSYDGGYEDYLEAKAERLALANRTETNRQNFLRTELEWLRRQPKARTGKQKARIGRAESAIETLAPVQEKTAALSFEATRTGKTILELKDLRVEIGGKQLIDHLTLMLTKGERIGIVGRNGTGKTTLLKTIMGDWKQVFGDVVIGANTKIAYFDQARAGLDDAASIYDNVSEGRGRIEMGDQILEVRAYLERFLFDPQKQKQPVGSLSGGERARVALAKLLRHGANLIMLDEPTNDLDVATLSALEEMLIAFDGTALVVTHDRWFLNRIATSILAFEGDGKAIVYAGNYETYRRLKAEAKERESLIPPPSVPSAKAAEQANRKPKNPRSITYAEQIELDGIMEKIEQAEAAVQKIEAQLADPQLYSTRGDEVPALRKQLLAAQEAAGRLLARWEELEAKKSKG